MSNHQTPIQPVSIYLKSSEYTSKNGVCDYTFDLYEYIHTHNNVDVFLKLESFFFTNSFYSIGNYNDTIYYEITGKGTYSTKITHGFYGINDLVKLLNTTFTGVFNFYWSSYTYRVTIICGSTFRLLPGDNNIYDILGFSNYGTEPDGNLIYVPNLIGPLQTRWDSIKLFNLMNVQQIKVCCGNLALKSFGIDGKPKQNIINSFRVVVGPGEIQNFYNVSDFKYQLNENFISALNIILLDQNNNQIDFNGIEWFMNLTFSFEYKKDTILPKTLLDDYKLDLDLIEPVILDDFKEQQDKELDEYIDDHHLLS
jgi:hypothetical protein